MIAYVMSARCSLYFFSWTVYSLQDIDFSKANQFTDELEHMSFQDGENYNATLMPLCAGDALPDRSIPVQWIMYDLWESMRACDRDLANGVLEPVFTFMKAQTSKTRLSIKGLDEYLDYRQGDVGQA